MNAAVEVQAVRVGAPGRGTTTSGIARLDDMLGGGFRTESMHAVCGPSFSGRSVLGLSFVLAGVRRGVPAIIVLTDCAPEEARERMRALEPRFDDHERAGLVRFVDAYSRGIGRASVERNVASVASACDLDGIAQAVERIQDELGPERGQRLLVLSLSTILACAGARDTFCFLRSLTGRARAGGATGLFVLGPGLHAPSELELLLHALDGALELREAPDGHVLRVRGGSPAHRGWVEYAFSDEGFEVTGSFGTGRIR